MTQTRDIWPELTLLFRDFFLDDDIQLHAGMTSRDVVGWDSLNNIALMSAIQQHFRINSQFAIPIAEECRRPRGMRRREVGAMIAF